MTVRTTINVVLIDSQDTIRTLQMTVRTTINVVLIDPQDTIRTLQMTIRTIINVVWNDPQDTIRTLLWGCILIKWNSPIERTILCSRYKLYNMQCRFSNRKLPDDGHPVARVIPLH